MNTLDIFRKRRTEIISDLLDNPYKNGIYQTTKCYNELDNLFIELLKLDTRKKKLETL